jgi:hypothetical protein
MELPVVGEAAGQGVPELGLEVLAKKVDVGTQVSYLSCSARCSLFEMIMMCFCMYDDDEPGPGLA